MIVGGGGLFMAILLAVFYLYLLGKLNEVSQRGAYWTGLAATVVYVGSFSVGRFTEAPNALILFVLGLAGMIVALICTWIIWRHDFGGP